MMQYAVSTLQEIITQHHLEQIYYLTLSFHTLTVSALTFNIY